MKRHELFPRFFHVVVPLDSVLPRSFIFLAPSILRPRLLLSVYTGLVSIHPVAWQFVSEIFITSRTDGNALYRPVETYRVLVRNENMSDYRVLAFSQNT